MMSLHIETNGKIDTVAPFSYKIFIMIIGLRIKSVLGTILSCLLVCALTIVWTKLSLFDFFNYFLSILLFVFSTLLFYITA